MKRRTPLQENLLKKIFKKIFLLYLIFLFSNPIFAKEKWVVDKSLSKIVSVVTQESILFNDSIYNNLLVGKKNANKKEIIKASKAAYAHEFIQELPKGYESIIGELGNKLSGGQKQRLTIARALLKNPEILILDEATSALDSESEGKVQKALEKLMHNRTSLIISHRLSTIKKSRQNNCIR